MNDFARLEKRVGDVATLIGENVNVMAKGLIELGGIMAREQVRPSVLYRPALSKDGNQWCALYGEDLQTGVAGFGSSPADAMSAFDEAWDKLFPDDASPEVIGERLSWVRMDGAPTVRGVYHAKLSHFSSTHYKLWVMDDLTVCNASGKAIEPPPHFLWKRVAE